MRALTVMSMLLLSACAAGGRDSATRADPYPQTPIRYDRLGTITTQDMSDLDACGDNQVNWCNGSRARKSCTCLSIREVERRTEKAIRSLDSRKN